MTATELAALIVAIASIVAVVLLGFGLVTMASTLKEVRAAVDLLRTETLPVVGELGDTVRSANAELERVDGILETAESISGNLEVASRLATVAVSGPVIKAMALASGTGEAARSLRQRRGHS